MSAQVQADHSVTADCVYLLRINKYIKCTTLTFFFSSQGDLNEYLPVTRLTSLIQEPVFRSPLMRGLPNMGNLKVTQV